MSLEAAIAELTAAVKENTAAHAKLAAVAAAAVSEEPKAEEPKAEEPKAEEPKAEEPKAPAKKPAAKKAPAKKAPAKKPAAKKAPELKSAVSAAEIKKIAASFLGTDDEDQRDERKKNVIGALQHLGASKLPELESDEDRAKLAGYIAHWEAGLPVDFEEIDSKIEGDDADADADADGDEDDDDLLG